ncbi:nicotinate phosphoribosyltransferase [Pontibacter anaerobius]|uniref:Nicotinate phosphoribosyltransferase n=1 Tax=Pontibacter anaerobius TaxID=2993940 RepID=A0ABT3RC48_9BACT|nr:nicotinate phosphoribosyltransferase [Pontibacter anaerobius]MCX2738993.1 nicotinate phosphoribosyltransferase [Pontibacter anaerobius]
MLSFSISGTYTDLYEITMGQTYFLEGRQEEPASFDYFFRKIPDKGGYVLFAGLHDLLDVLEDLHFTDEDIAYLQDLNLNPSFIDFLKGFNFKGTLYAAAEGEVVFPNTPVVRVEGTILETQLVESLLLNILNFESLVATKASRMRYVAGNRILSDFGLRRAHGPGAVLAARAAMVGGFNSTSNVYAAQKYGIPAAGTMAHSFIESYDDELEAFRAFARARPDGCIFLVDTYNTLKSGVPNAITAARELEALGHKAIGIRLDSGDLATLAKRSRTMLNEAGLPYLKIITSNQLDEYVIKELLEQQAPIDIFGVGTKLVTGAPDAALDGVYKIAMAAGKPRLKLSETKEKITLPGIKQVLRLMDTNGMFYGADAIVLAAEGDHADLLRHPFEDDTSLRINGYLQEPLLQKVMENGKRTAPQPPLPEITAFSQSRLKLLPDAFKHFDNPQGYNVGLSQKLWDLREQLKQHYRQ